MILLDSLARSKVPSFCNDYRSLSDEEILLECGITEESADGKTWGLGMERGFRAQLPCQNLKHLKHAETGSYHRIGRMKNGSKMACGLAAFSQESTVFVSSGLDGGGKKRKKKTYTKPKLLRWQIWNDMDRYGSEMQSGSAKFSWVV